MLLPVAGVTRWPLALYLGLSPVGDWFGSSFNFADRNLVTSQKACDESQEAHGILYELYASLLSSVPLQMVGALCELGILQTLARSWVINMGLIAGIGSGIDKQGPRDG